jgi:hypothetical protein
VHAKAVTGWRDPATGKVYAYRPTSTGPAPQVPDTLIGALRGHFPGLFGPNGQLVAPSPGQAPPPRGQPKPGLPTSEQQSGRTADAVTRLHGELKSRYSQISDAEEKLSEALLNAHATTADGQQKLNDIQAKIVNAVNNPALSLDTPAGEQTFLKFLRSQLAGIGDVLQSGTLEADDQANAVAALSNLYAADDESGRAAASAPPAEPSQADPPPVASGDLPPAALNPSLGPPEPMPDPNLGDLGLGPVGAPPGADPFSSLPAALGNLPQLGGLGSAPLDSLGGLAPLAGLASQLGDQGRRADNTDSRDKAVDDSTAKPADKPAGKPGPDDTKNPAPQGQSGTAGDQPAAQPPPPQPAPNGPPGAGAPPAAPAAAPPTAVALPDGSSATARTPALAQAVKAYLAGTPVDAAYRQAGIELPPPGTPVTDPVDPSALSCGAIGMFKDHYVVALSAVKAAQDGQVVPLASVTSGPDFLGWLDPSALGTPAAAPTSSPAAPAPARAASG